MDQAPHRDESPGGDRTRPTGLALDRWYRRVPDPYRGRGARPSRVAAGPVGEDVGRRTAAIAEAVFERTDVLGATDFSFTLTAHTRARGWDAAFGAGVVRVEEGRSGRGERA